MFICSEELQKDTVARLISAHCEMVGSWWETGQNPCYFFQFVGTKDSSKKSVLRTRISNYMDRAENIKKYLDQEKEGKSLFLRTCLGLGFRGRGQLEALGSKLLLVGAWCGLGHLCLGA